MIAQMIRAVLFAIATVATLVGSRASRSARRGSILPGLYFARRTSDVMPTMSSLRRYLGPPIHRMLWGHSHPAVPSQDPACGTRSKQTDLISQRGCSSKTASARGV